MAIFKHHTSCPKCGSSDALAVYDDFGTYCFSCGTVGGATVPSFRKETDEYDEDAVVLPHDLSHDFPQEVVDWIAPTGLTIQELYANRYFFSKSAGGLVRLLYREHLPIIPECLRSNLGAFETRFLYRKLQTTSPKSKFTGSKENVYAYCGPPNSVLQQTASTASEQACTGQGKKANGQVHCDGRRRPRQLVIVEDSLSSLKVGRVTCSAPLFGSSISNNKLSRLVKPFDEVVVWLDSDKLNSARNISARVQMLGKKSRVVYTELDPKYLNAEDYI